eukprot:1145080-Pelagomonas_calceolata.AAC.2
MSYECILQIYEGQSVLMKVQSKFTVCGVSTNKPGNPVECVNTDSEDSTHFAVSGGRTVE